MQVPPIELHATFHVLRHANMRPFFAASESVTGVKDKSPKEFKTEVRIETMDKRSLKRDIEAKGLLARFISWQ